MLTTANMTAQPAVVEPVPESVPESVQEAVQEPRDPTIYLSKQDWPHQGPEMDQFYGRPETDNHGGVTASWEARNLKRLEFPWRATLAWDIGQPLRSFRVHVSCAGSMSRILECIWELYAHDQEKIEADGLHLFGGSYNYRLKRGGSTLSTHAYGAAIDINPDGCPMLPKRPKDAKSKMPDVVVDAFRAESWAWGGDWNSPWDSQHFQSAIV